MSYRESQPSCQLFPGAAGEDWYSMLGCSLSAAAAAIVLVGVFVLWKCCIFAVSTGSCKEWKTGRISKLSVERKVSLVSPQVASQASYVSASSISVFRAAIVRSVASCLLDGPVGVDPAINVIWSRHLAHWPDEVPRIFRMLDFVAHGAEGHGPVHLLLVSDDELGFAWDWEENGWVRAALPPLWMLSGPIQHFQSAIFDAWQLNVSAQLADRKGSRRAQFWDIKGSLQLLNSSHLRERNNILLRSILCGGVRNGLLPGKARGAEVPCRFCGGRDGDGHLFWQCTFPPILQVCELPEFMPLMARDRSNWPRCLLWHGWLPGLSTAGERDPWAASLV